MSRSNRILKLLLPLVLVSVAFAGCAADDGGDGTTTTTTPPAGTTPPTGATPPTDDGTNLPDLPVSGATDTYGLTSGSTGGVYYAIANGIQAAVRNATAPGFTISDVPTSGGSVTNVERLRMDDYQLALMQNDVAYIAYNGEGQFEGNAYEGLRAVAALYPEMVQIVTLKEANILTLDDLNGKRVILGAPGSGAAVNAQQILNASGVQAQTDYLDLNTAAERLKEGAVDAVFWTGGIPTGAITGIATTHPVRIIPITGEDKEALQAEAPFYANVTLPAGTYPGVDEDVETVAVIAVLVAREDVPADDVASLLRIIFDGNEVQRSHPGQGPNIKLENAQNGVIGIPWHEGARYYFASKGQPVSDDAS